jgi:hypothetical protein
MCHELASQFGGLPHPPMHRKYVATPVVRGNTPELGVNSGVHVCTGLVHSPQLTYRWTATGASARDASRAYFAQLVRRPRLWITFGLVWIALSLYWNLLFADGTGAYSRMVWAPVFGLVTTAAFFVLLMSVRYVQTVRRMRLRLTEGTVLESGFEDGVVRVCGPLSDSTLTSAGIQWIRTSGAWVLVRQRGVPLIGLWPAALFPRLELERLGRAVGQAP